MEGDYKIEDIYQGGYSSLSPEYGPLFTGYRADTKTIGTATSPFTTNILQEVSEKLRPGQRVVEVSMGIFPDRAPIEAIPKQHLEEVNRLAKLSGVDISVHGPLTDASGIDSRQGKFDEQEREIAERKILQALEKGHMVNPDSNVNVTFHTANNLPGARYNKTKNGEEMIVMPIMNQETGQLRVIEKEEKYYPGKGKQIFDVQRELNSLNYSEWLNGLTQIETHKKDADQLMSGAVANLAPILSEGKSLNEINLSPTQKASLNQLQKAEIFLDNAQASFNSLYNKAYRFSDDEARKNLNEIHKLWEEESKSQKKEIESGKFNRVSMTFKESQLLDKSILAIKQIYGNGQSDVPQLYKPAEQYALEKSTQTFGNAAFEAYKKYRDKSPVVSIENPPAGMGLSRAEDLKRMVEGSREQFVKNATKSTSEGGLGMSKGEAKKQAEKLIGATWDVGHINQLRQFGFEKKDIIKEAGKIAPYLKHIHMSDNFGLENVELPMGMGNVDFKEVMNKLGKKGEKAKKIAETGHWWTTFRESPIASTFQALGAPIYGGTTISPYWNQVAGLQQTGYFSGYGMMLPQINYETFGAGFSNLPQELGGQRQGGQGSRLSGRGME